MILNYKYSFLSFCFGLLFFYGHAQILDLPLSKANTQLYNGNIHAFGLSTQDKKTKLFIYKLNLSLTKTDSLVIDLGKSTAENFLQLTSDTLHGFLNVYVQKKDVSNGGANGKKTVSIFRLNSFFKLITTTEDVDIARLNSISAFENEIFYNKADVYTIRSVDDTSGKQFYLNKYSLKSELKNFEYSNKWQFPFERKNINSAHIVYADNLIVMLFVNVISGGKKGQWLLKINTISGLLLRATKLNDKGDNSFFTCGKTLYDTALKQIYVQGQKFTEAEFSQKENKVNLCGKPFVTIYLAEVDSAGDLLSKEEFKISVTEVKSVTNKIPVNYIIRTNDLVKTNMGEILIEADIFRGLIGDMCYTYCNSNNLKLVQAEDKYTLEKTAITVNPLIEKYYLNKDKLDMNGKLCLDSISNFEKLYYRPITFNVKVGYKVDDANNPIWILKKTDTKKNMQNYSFLSPVKKIYALSSIKEINKTESPDIIYLNRKQFIITQTLNERFLLQLYNW